MCELDDQFAVARDVAQSLLICHLRDADLTEATTDEAVRRIAEDPTILYFVLRMLADVAASVGIEAVLREGATTDCLQRTLDLVGAELDRHWSANESQRLVAG